MGEKRGEVVFSLAPVITLSCINAAMGLNKLGMDLPDSKYSQIVAGVVEDGEKHCGRNFLLSLSLKLR